MKSPPGKRVHWHIQSNLTGERFIVTAKTAFEAAAQCGLILSQCKDNIYWKDLPMMSTFFIKEREKILNQEKRYAEDLNLGLDPEVRTDEQERRDLGTVW